MDKEEADLKSIDRSYRETDNELVSHILVATPSYFATPHITEDLKMSDLLHKSLNDVNASDLDEFVSRSPAERPTLEFKGQVPARANETPWSATNLRLPNHAKDVLIKEVIALLNTYGGHLLLGVRQTDDLPHRADSVQPIEHCQELAKALDDLLMNTIDPATSAYEVRAVPYPDGADEGVVIVRTSPSRLRPHRDNRNRRVYARIGGSAVELTMRDVHDRVLQAYSEAERIEKRLASRQLQANPGVQETTRRQGSTALVRVTAMPTLLGFYLPRPYDEPIPYITSRRFSVTIDGHSHILNFPMYPHEDSTEALRPIYRGAFRRYHRGSSRNTVYEHYVYEDGLIELIYYGSVKFPEGENIGPLTLLAMVAAVLHSVAVIRNRSGLPGAEMIMELEVLYSPLPHLEPDLRSPFHEVGSFTLSDIKIPPEETSFGSVLEMCYNDLRNLVGHRHCESFEIRVI